MFEYIVRDKLLDWVVVQPIGLDAGIMLGIGVVGLIVPIAPNQLVLAVRVRFLVFPA